MKRTTIVTHVVSCPLCGSGERIPVLRSPDWSEAVDGEFQIVRCGDCRHLYMNPAPVDSSIADCYPSDYGPHRRGVSACAPTDAPEGDSGGADEEAVAHRPQRPWYLSPVVKRIPGPRMLYRWVTDTKSVWIPPEPGERRRALELGCSSGWFLAQLQEQGWQPVGVDLIEQPLAKARAAGFEVRQGTLETVHFDAATFDAVFAWMVIEHVPRPRETLQEVHRVLRPGGWFAFSVPNVSCWEPYVFGRHWPGYDLPRHLQHFTPRRLRTLLAEHDFEVERVIPQPSFMYWLGSLSSLLHERAPRWRLSRRISQAKEHNPPLAWYFALGPLARLNALLRQSGRLTIVTKRS